MTMFFALLPGVWIAYGVCRWGLSYAGLGVMDQIAMSFLAAIVYLVGAMVIAWERRG